MNNLTIKKEDLKSLLKESWSISWPMTFIMFFIFLIGIVDVFVAGKIGKEVQAAYGFVFQIYFVFTIVSSSVTVGTVSLVSRLFASGRKKDLSKTVFSSMLSVSVVGIIFAAIGVIFLPNIIKNLNLPLAIRQYSPPLFRIYALGLLFQALLMNSNGILRACKMVRKSLATMAIVCFLNIVLNFFFVFGTPLGFKGIALATVVSVFIGTILNLFYIRGAIVPSKEFSITLMKKIIEIGWPMLLLQVGWQLGFMFIFLVLSSLPEHKVEILAAFTNGLKIESAVFLPAFAFNMANAVVVGNLIGANMKENAFNNGLITAAIGAVIVTLLAVIIILNAKSILSFLSDNHIVIREGVKYLYISLIAEPFMAWGVILSGGLNGAGDTRSVMLIVILSVWLLRVPLSYIFGIIFGGGAVAIWWSMNLSIFAQAIFISRRYMSRKWLKLCVLKS